MDEPEVVYRVCLPHILSLCQTQQLNRDIQPSVQVLARPRDGSAPPQTVNERIRTRFLQFEFLLIVPFPILAQPARLQVEGAQPIISVEIFIVQSGLESEPRLWDTGYDPFCVPYWFCISRDGLGSEPEVNVVWMSGWEVGIQLSEDERVRMTSIDI